MITTIFSINGKISILDSEGGGSGAATPTQLNPIQRKKKPKRRSTGVVNLEMDVSYRCFGLNIFFTILSFQDPRSEESADEVRIF